MRTNQTNQTDIFYKQLTIQLHTNIKTHTETHKESKTNTDENLANQM